MLAEEAITLKEVQLRLGTPQHVLIHLCEKGVIEADVEETSGRGKRRKFSQRNLFEFAVALALRKLELSVATTAFVLRLLRSFTRATEKLVPGFVVPASLAGDGLELALYLHDDRLLVFSAKGDALRAPVLLGVDIEAATAKPTARPRLQKLDALPPEYEARLEVDLTKIAKNLVK